MARIVYILPKGYRKKNTVSKKVFYHENMFIFIVKGTFWAIFGYMGLIILIHEWYVCIWYWKHLQTTYNSFFHIFSSLHVIAWLIRTSIAHTQGSARQPLRGATLSQQARQFPVLSFFLERRSLSQGCHKKQFDPSLENNCSHVKPLPYRPHVKPLP